MANKKVTSPGQKLLYAAYKATNRYDKNRKRRLDRHLKAHPNDKQAEKARKGVITYRRQKPGKGFNIPEITPKTSSEMSIHEATSRLNYDRKQYELNKNS